MIMEKTEDLNNRIEWIDIAKCIGILLVIIGHTVYYNVYGSGLRGIIFSFHMPLFFILSSITFKNSKDGNQFINKIQRGYKKLIIPALTAYIIYIY